MNYAFAPVRENKRYIRPYEREHSIHYEINPNKIMFKDRKLRELESWAQRKFETLLVLNTPQKRVTVGYNLNIW